MKGRHLHPLRLVVAVYRRMFDDSGGVSVKSDEPVVLLKVMLDVCGSWD